MLLKLCPIQWGFFMNIKFLVLVFIGIFFSCLGLSKLANFCFDISSDYLTATATFFTAFVALYLYNDWKDPFLLEKIESDQRVIRSNIRKFKHSLVNLLDYIHGNGLGVKLNNDDEYSREYKQRLNDVLDEIDDLYSLIKNYESIIIIQKDDLAIEHLSEIKDAEQALREIFNILNKYDLHKNYCESYMHIKIQTLNEKFDSDVRAITETFHDTLSSYFKDYVKNLKGQ